MLMYPTIGPRAWAGIATYLACENVLEILLIEEVDALAPQPLHYRQGSEFGILSYSLGGCRHQRSLIKAGPLSRYGKQIRIQQGANFFIINAPDFSFREAALVKHGADVAKVCGLKLGIQVKLGEG